MALQPKKEPGSPPILASNSHRNLEQMSISELVRVLRVAWQTEDYDRVEEVLLNREAKLKAQIGPLQEKCEFERLMRLKAEEELKKRGEQCEKGKRAQESYETLMKEVKRNGLQDKSTIDKLRSKTKELKCENHKLMELKKKWDGDGDVVGELRKRVAELENEKLELEKEKVRLEDEKKKNLATIDELEGEKRKLEVENIKAYAKFVELFDRVVKLEDDSKLLKSVSASDGGNTEEKPQGDPRVFLVAKDEVDVGCSASFQRSKDISQSHGASVYPFLGGAQNYSTGVKSGLVNVIVIEDSSDDDDDGGIAYVSQRTQVQKVETHKRKLSYSDADNSSSSSGSFNFEDLPLSSRGKCTSNKTNK